MKEAGTDLAKANETIGTDEVVPFQNLEFRESVARLEEMLRAGGNFGGFSVTPVDGVENHHHFIPGVYVREARIPQGRIVTGRIHRTEHMCIVIGDVDITDEHSQKRYVGYNIFKSMPGTKRALFTNEDTVFLTIHRTDETNIDKLTDLLTVETYEDFEKVNSLESSTKLEVLP